ncbi:Fc.00g064230.m01.CDS01 [Cosmosporella sp. VM-42]
MAERRRSVPSGTTSMNPPAITIADTTPLTSSSSSPLAAPTHSAKLFAQADYLAKMTYELSLRAVSSKAEHLERDIHKLVRCTEDNKQFRIENEERLNNINREIMAVKSHMSAVEKGQNGVKADYEEQRRLTMEVIGGFRREMVELKGLMDGLISHLDQLPTIEDIRNETQTQQASPRVETRAASRAKRRAQTLPPHQQPNTFTNETRIKETINSTKRWNRDYKSTPFPDGLYVSNYLKQQSKRDPSMAVFLQRALQRRIRLRGDGKLRSKPQTLEEFCHDVTWRDVIETAEEVLVTNKERTLRALR